MSLSLRFGAGLARLEIEFRGFGASALDEECDCADDLESVGGVDEHCCYENAAASKPGKYFRLEVESERQGRDASWMF